MYIRLTSTQHVTENGILKTFHPGDWIDVGRQTAQQWIAENKAEIPAGRPNELIPPGAGAVVVGHEAGWSSTAFGEIEHQYSFTYKVPYTYTLLWTPDLVTLRPELIVTGLSLLEKWDLAVPIYSYDKLAKDIKAPKGELSLTQQAILDMRQPVYEPGLMFVRQHGPGDAVVAAFQRELEILPGCEVHLAFVRALWAIKPRINALPVTWHEPVDTRRPR